MSFYFTSSNHQFKRVYVWLKSLLRFVFLQETDLFVKATQQTLAVKPQVFLSRHCPGHSMMGTCHQLSIKPFSVKNHSWSCLTLQNKWKASTSAQQKTKQTQQLPQHIFLCLVRRNLRRVPLKVRAVCAKIIY